MPREFDFPSPEEDAAIQRGIELDPDSPELGDDFFENARPASETLSPDVYAGLLFAEQAGNMEGAAAKAQTMLVVGLDVFEMLRASGPDWQFRANEALRQLVRR